MSNHQAAVARKLEDPDFMRKLLRRSFLSESLMALSIGALVGDRIWRDHHPPPDRFFYTDGKHRPYEVAPLDTPVMSDADVLLWTLRSVVAAYTVNFKEYHDQLSQASAHFTVRGWQGFGTDYIGTGNFEELKQARLVTTAEPYQAATIRERAVIGGTLTYVVEIPLNVTYENAIKNVSRKLLVRALVVRARETEHPDGVAIDEVNDRPA